MQEITYNLRAKNETSDVYYEEISKFSEECIEKATKMLGEYVERYILYIEKNKIEKARSFEEYAFELMAIGVLWKNYSKNISVFSEPYGRLLTKLYNLRRKHSKMKKHIDLIRGILSDALRKEGKRAEVNLDNFKKFIKWLEATGEFKEECKRFKIWADFLSTDGSISETYILSETIVFAEWFSYKGLDQFSKYIEHVGKFRRRKRRHYKFKEDALFCLRNEEEYLLNMVGADILNNVFKERFLKTSQKAVLLPLCMANPRNKKCMIEKNGIELKCVSCSDNCQINKIKSHGEKNGYSVAIIPHSSDFTKWLERWKEQDHTGVVGIACTLNLLTGGYEMKGFDIPAQCVLLDYCGCKNHWHKKGIPTEININELERVVKGA